MQFAKSLLLISILGMLAGCSSTTKKRTREHEYRNSPPISELSENIDYQKAAKINIELGLNYLRQDQIIRAKAKLTRAKMLAPELPEVHYSYGYFLERVGEVQDAEKAYQKAISLNPKGGNEHNNYGAFLCRQHKFRQAEKEFLRAVEDSGYMNTAEALENAGLCVSQIPDMAKAAEYFEKALRYDSGRPNSLIEMAVISYRQGKISQAQDYHHRFLQISAPNPRALLLGIELARLTGDKDKEASYRLLLKAQYPEGRLDQPLQLSAVSLNTVNTVGPILIK